MPVLILLALLLVGGALNGLAPGDLLSLLCRLGVTLILVWGLFVIAALPTRGPRESRSRTERLVRGKAYADGAP